MKLNYDKKTDSLYLELRGGKDENNKVLGIEVLAVKDIIPSFVPSKTKIIYGSKLAAA